MTLGTRVLTLSGERQSIAISIHVELPEAHEGGWRCLYSIGWPHQVFNSEGWGADAFQATILTLRKIGTEIYNSPYHRSGKLTWTEGYVGYGFPVEKNVRELLVGDDAAFFG